MSGTKTSNPSPFFAFLRHILLLEFCLDTQWFRDVNNLCFDVVYQRLSRREVTLVLSVPWLCRLVITVASVKSVLRRKPLIIKTGFEVSSQFLRVAWKHPVMGCPTGRHFKWVWFWRELFGMAQGSAYVIRFLGSEEYHFYQNEAEVLRVKTVEAEAILYGQRVKGRWWWPFEMEQRWVEIQLSAPIATRMGVVTKHVYNRPDSRHLQRPLDMFRHELLQKGIEKIQ